jgi:hypothetical protein
MEETMKKQILSAVVTFSVIVTLSIAGFAGLGGNLESNIPFDFMVNGKKLPAGKYIVETGSQTTMAIRSFETKQGAVSIAQPFQVRAGGKPQLIFHRYGNQYFLVKVLSDTGGRELPRTKAEREAAKAGRDQLAMKDAAPEIITISAQVGQ